MYAQEQGALLGDKAAGGREVGDGGAQPPRLGRELKHPAGQARAACCGREGRSCHRVVCKWQETYLFLFYD